MIILPFIQLLIFGRFRSFVELILLARFVVKLSWNITSNKFICTITMISSNVSRGQNIAMVKILHANFNCFRNKRYKKQTYL